MELLDGIMQVRPLRAHLTVPPCAAAQGRARVPPPLSPQISYVCIIC